MSNWFVLAAGILYLGAAVVYWTQDRYAMCIVFLAYAVSNFALCKV